VTKKDISEYLVLEPYPYDRRCGCQICNECVKGYPCGTCDGNCAVCRGMINRGPNELGTEWSIRPADWVQGTDGDDSVNSDLDLPDPDQSEIVRAVRFDNFHRVNEIVTGPNCPNPQELGEALVVACEGARVPIARVLINAGAFLNAIRPYTRDTCLHSICRQGEVGADFIGLVRMLVDRQANVNMRNSDGVTPLHCAIVNDHEEIVTILVLNGNADLNIRDNDGNTAFLKVCAAGNERLVRMFLSTGRADTNTRSNDGSSCLHWAFRNNRKSIVKILTLELHCDPNFRTNDGAAPLHWAFRSDYEENIRILLNAGADVNLRNAHGSTPLHCACMYGSISMARILVFEAHADVNKQSNDGSTPLHRACSNGFENIARMLALEAHADVNLLDRYGRTPLHDAISYNNDSIAKMLICEVHANLKPTGAIPFPLRTRRIVAQLLGDLCAEEINVVGVKQMVYDGPSNRPIPTQIINVDNIEVSPKPSRISCLIS
jgi:ankyrin repeat protein